MDVQIGPSGPYLPQTNPPEAAPKKSRKKFWIVVGAFLAFVLLLFGYIFWQAFDLWLGQRRVERTAEMWRKAEQELHQMQLADTYGGKTPQETLRMYIEAVEKGDYELASKYFVIENQKSELGSFNNSSEADLQKFLEILGRLVLVDKEQRLRESYKISVQQGSIDENYYTEEEYVRDSKNVPGFDKEASMSTKVEGLDFIVNLVLYPSGVWKIEEM